MPPPPTDENTPSRLTTMPAPPVMRPALVTPPAKLVPLIKMPDSAALMVPPL